MSELFKNIVRLPPPHTARSYSQLTPVYTADEVAKTVASFEAELAKANERVAELDQENKEFTMLIANLVMRADVKIDLLQNPTYEKASEQLNKFAIEKKIEALEGALQSYVTAKFLPTTYAIQAFNDGVNHLYAHIQERTEQLRKEQE